MMGYNSDRYWNPLTRHISDLPQIRAAGKFFGKLDSPQQIPAFCVACAKLGEHPFLSALGAVPLSDGKVSYRFIRENDAGEYGSSECGFCSHATQYEEELEDANGWHFQVGSCCVTKIEDTGSDLVKDIRKAHREALKSKRIRSAAEQEAKRVADLFAGLHSPRQPVAPAPRLDFWEALAVWLKKRGDK